MTRYFKTFNINHQSGTLKSTPLNIPKYAKLISMEVGWSCNMDDNGDVVYILLGTEPITTFSNSNKGLIAYKFQSFEAEVNGAAGAYGILNTHYMRFELDGIKVEKLYFGCYISEATNIFIRIVYEL